MAYFGQDLHRISFGTFNRAEMDGDANQRLINYMAEVTAAADRLTAM